MIFTKLLFVKLIIHNRLAQKRHIKKDAGIIRHQECTVHQKFLHIMGLLRHDCDPVRARFKSPAVLLHLNMGIKNEPIILLFQKLLQFLTAEQRLKVLIIRCFSKRLPCRVMGAAPGRHNKNHLLFTLCPDQIIKPRQSDVLRHMFRISKRIANVFIFRLRSADKQIHIHIFTMQPFHFILDDAMLQKNLFSPRPDSFSCKMIK